MKCTRCNTDKNHYWDYSAQQLLLLCPVCDWKAADYSAPTPNPTGASSTWIYNHFPKHNTDEYFWVTDGRTVWPAQYYVMSNEKPEEGWCAIWDYWDFVWPSTGDWENIIAWQLLVAPGPPQRAKNHEQD
jgi:hypothetical protein